MEVSFDVLPDISLQYYYDNYLEKIYVWQTKNMEKVAVSAI